MNNMELVRLHFMLPINKEDILQEKTYFSKLSEQFISNSNVWTISDLFHTVLGIYLIESQFSKELLLSSKEFLKNCERNNCFMASTPNNPLFSLLKNSAPEQDIYSSYYGFLLSKILGLKTYPNSLGELVIKNFQSSGWFYPLTISNTIEDRRFHSELVFQSLFAVKILSILNKTSEIEFSSTLKVIDNLFDETKYLGVKSNILELKKLIQGKVEIEKTELKGLVEFLEKHYSKEKGGFYEYLFEEVKIDENTKRRQRFNNDYLVPSISATYSSIKIISMFYDNKEIEDFFTPKLRKIKEFLSNNICQVGGAGTEIKIAKFNANVGNKCSPQETLMKAASLGFIASNE
ncbi:hypothetical protein KKG83_04445 [Candidatus Micrarchaeota archaeon]|nr:hypothetical protein [Nanoarchaeota archaeon]MBU2476694.1 hypothetical protein [Candidatus Micrarchaeota archaeon]